MKKMRRRKMVLAWHICIGMDWEWELGFMIPRARIHWRDRMALAREITWHGHSMKKGREATVDTRSRLVFLRCYRIDSSTCTPPPTATLCNTRMLQ